MSGHNNPPSHKACLSQVVRRFYQNQAGSYAVMFALMLPVLVGLCGIGTEVGLWFFKQRDMQGAADTSAVSAATAFPTASPTNMSDLDLEADSVASSNGYTNGVNGTQVTVNRPPLSGAFTGVADAVEVIVQQPQKRLMSALYGDGPILIAARAVAVPRPGKGCVLALDPSVKNAAVVSGGGDVHLDCGLYSNSTDATNSTATAGGGLLTAYDVHAAGGVDGQQNITTAQGIFENQLPTADPYAGVDPGPTPSPCQPPKTYTSPATLDPQCYQKTTFNTTITLKSGVYYFTGDLNIQSQANVTGIGVTLVFVGNATLKIAGGATVDLRAIQDGPTAGIVVFGDRNPSGPTPSFALEGGSNQSFEGAIYVPAAQLTFSGGGSAKTTCTQIITRTISFSGESNLKLDCGGIPVDPFGADTAQLVE